MSGETHIHTLGYADDATLINETSGTVTDRVTTITAGSKKDVYMYISVDKTKMIHV